MKSLDEARCADCTCRSQDLVSGQLIGKTGGPLLAVIGQGPGEVERKEGTPFSGTSGLILDKTISQTRASEEISLLQTNAYICFPEEGEAESVLGVCKYRLYNTLEAFKPGVIVAMGEAAIRTLKGTESGVMRSLWKLGSSPYLTYPNLVVPTYNPAAILRNPHQYRTFSDSLECAIGALLGSRKALSPPITKVAENQEDVLDILDELKQERFLGLDLETTRLDPFLEHILTLILSPAPVNGQYKSYIIPWRLLVTREEVGPAVFKQLPNGGPAFDYVKEFLEGDRKFVIHNSPFDKNFLLASGIDIKVGDDPVLLHYAMDERTGPGTSHGLKPLSAQYLVAPDWEGPIWQYLKGKQDSFENIPEEVLHEYCRWDTPYVFALNEALHKEADPTALKLYEDYLLPYNDMLIDQQARGVYIDIPVLLQSRREAKDDADRLEGLLQEICGLPLFNPGSTHQVQGVLFKDFGLERPYNDEGDLLMGSGEPVLLALLKQNQGFMREVERLNEDSTVGSLVELVQELAPIDPKYAFLVGLLVRRDVMKDISTYYDGVAKFISPFDRCIHPFLHQSGTDTGRLTGTRPSLLNVKNSNKVKMPYSARPGYKLIYADQSQMELRTYACRMQDIHLRDLLVESDKRVAKGEKGGDIHSLVGRLCFPYFDQSPKWWRAIVKTIVYGVMYGRGPHAIARRHRIPIDDAISYREQILDLFPTVREYEREVVRSVHDNFEISTQVGRRKRYPFIPSDSKAYSHVKNSAINMPIQSLANEINMLSMLDVWKERGKTDIHPLWPTHDSVIYEAPEDKIEWSTDYIVKVMVGAAPRHFGEQYNFCPFKVEPTVGTHWGAISEEEGFFALVLSLVERE
jgi:uracil-DNA glycosylase family 4